MVVEALLAVALASSSEPQALKYSDASNLPQAVAMVSMEIHLIEETRKYCAAQVPHLKRHVDHYSYQWNDHNGSETAAVASYLKARDRSEFESLQAPFLATAVGMMKASRTVMGAERFCLASIEQLKTGDRNVSRRTPDASTYLNTYLAENPPPSSDVERGNTVDGCVKQSLNKGGDLDAARAMCACVADIIHGDLSPSEFAELDSVAQARGDVTQLGSMQRVAPKLAECAVPGAAGTN